jgi:hypothetical protein
MKKRSFVILVSIIIICAFMTGLVYGHLCYDRKLLAYQLVSKSAIGHAIRDIECNRNFFGEQHNSAVCTFNIGKYWNVENKVAKLTDYYNDCRKLSLFQSQSNYSYDTATLFSNSLILNNFGIFQNCHVGWLVYNESHQKACINVSCRGLG